ncbi:MAG: hydrogenase maturation protease [Bacteroidetes bacterium]|nr:MAG: hydrogenase maturation protease [Bacteroidota bacterium]PTM12280.1 MAG: hydrogenase maturation protease [Bacteroidota bacterium]
MDFSASPTTPKKPLLIMGIGNLLMGDEGVGVHFAQGITPDQCPPGTAILDGGTGGFHLMPYLEAYEKIILVDATLGDGAAGTIRLIRPRFASDFPRAMSTHDIGLKDLVDGMLLLNILPEIHLFTVSIAEVQNMQVGLSPPVAACLPALRESVLALANKILC